MSAPASDSFERVLVFWFGSLDKDGLATGEYRARWWKKDPSFDARIRVEFSEEHRAVGARSREAWLATPRGRLAYVIVLDQFSRNLFRDAPGMFAHDPQALAAAKEGLMRGDDRALSSAHERTFLYMPLMHSEELADQERCVELFKALRDELVDPARAAVASNVDFAIRHRDIVARFHRFPHRNTILGRPSTEEETAFLAQPGSSF